MEDATEMPCPVKKRHPCCCFWIKAHTVRRFFYAAGVPIVPGQLRGVH